MCHHTLLHANFHVFFARRRRDLAVKTQGDGCRRCGDVLHKNRHQRKPRGGGLTSERGLTSACSMLADFGPRHGVALCWDLAGRKGHMPCHDTSP
jgi:hypothetical protein